MPPEIKITQEKLLETAFSMTREKGFDMITARKLAREMKCSTQPIFRIYENMAALKNDLIAFAQYYFNQHLADALKSEDPMLQIGLSYIGFAEAEKHLFQMMFMSESIKENWFQEFFLKKGLDDILRRQYNYHLYHLDDKQLKFIFMQMWMIAHGIASLIAVSKADFSQEEIETLMQNARDKLMKSGKH